MGDPQWDRARFSGETVRTLAPPVWDLYPFEEVAHFDCWPVYPYGRNWTGWDMVQPEHVHQWVDITAVDDPQFEEMCGVCALIRRSDK